MLRFNNKGNTQNNTVRFGLFSHLRFPRTVKHQQNKRLKRYCPWHRVENFFLASLPHVSWRLKVSFRKGPSSSAVLICFEESRHCPCKKCFSHLETNAWSPANTSTLTVKHLEPVQESGTLPRDSEHSTGDQLAETHRQAPVQKQQYWNAALGNSFLCFFLPSYNTHTHTPPPIWAANSSASLATSPVRCVFFGHLDATPTSVVQPGQLKVSTG